MKPSNEEEKGDLGDLRLRRFTMGMGAVFFLIAWGGVQLKSGNIPLPLFGTLAISVEIPKLILGVIILATLYAFCLFCYRKWYLQPPPLKMRRWFVDYGVVVQYVPKEVLGEDEFAKRDLHLHNLLKGNNPPYNIEQVSKTVPSKYYSNFFISLEKQYSEAKRPTCDQVITQVLEQYFPSITAEELNFEKSGGYALVKISSLQPKTKFSMRVEDFIYFLPILPYVAGFPGFLFCLGVWLKGLETSS